MSKKNNKTTEKLIDDLRDLPRAQPRHDLFPSIMESVKRPVMSVISLSRLQLSAVATVALLVVNVMAVKTYAQATNRPSEDTVLEDSTAEPLIADFKLY